jgi:glycosyltransferase involved in cell wall biosynthesis
MKLLLAHNSYQQVGGEDMVFQAEARLLESRGNEVVRYTKHNDQVAQLGRASLARITIWNGDTYREVRALLRRERPEVVHVHNTFPLISPAIYYAARAEGVPVVQTLHNYRLVCPNALLFRDGHRCEECLGKRIPIPGVVHACYRQSRAVSGAVAAMLTVHRGVGTWTRMVDVFIALSEFARNKHIQGGLPAERIVVKPNFIAPDPGQGARQGGYALYVGRLSAEKGVDTLVAAWSRLARAIPLRIVGDGPLASQVQAAVQRVAGVEWLGRQSRGTVIELMKSAEFLVVPSLCYEAFCVVVAEAYGVGVPVIASDLGSVGSLVQHGSTGLHFRTGDAADLSNRVEWATAHPAEMSEMARRARQAYEMWYTADRNYEMLMQIYQQAIAGAAVRSAERGGAPRR